MVFRDIYQMVGDSASKFKAKSMLCTGKKATVCNTGKYHLIGNNATCGNCFVYKNKY